MYKHCGKLFPESLAIMFAYRCSASQKTKL